jgi:hypothetical protein
MDHFHQWPQAVYQQLMITLIVLSFYFLQLRSHLGSRLHHSTPSLDCVVGLRKMEWLSMNPYFERHHSARS